MKGPKLSSQHTMCLLMVLINASYYAFHEFRALLSQLNGSPHYSMFIPEEDLATDYEAARSLQQSSREINSGSKLSNKVLPLFNETGGLVVFLHMAKTGGTTVRNEFMELPNVDVKRVIDENQLRQIGKKLDWYLSSENSKARLGMERVMLLEVHGGHGELITIFQMHSFLQTWRARAIANNKKVFVFTLLREPKSFYVSYFNAFKNPGCRWSWCDPPLLNLTEDNLLESMVPNHQCQFLARMHNKLENQAVPVSRSECESAYSLLRADADWIGTTEMMHGTTLPLLSYMFSGTVAEGINLAIHNKHRGKQLVTKSLSADAHRRIRNASTLDQYLYDSAIQDFSINMWVNFVTA